MIQGRVMGGRSSLCHVHVLVQLAVKNGAGACNSKFKSQRENVGSEMKRTNKKWGCVSIDKIRLTR